jgi:lipopolysaccharide export system protein LptA
METLKKEGLIIFEGRVEARHNNNTQYADRMEVYLDDKGEKVLRAISTGNVKVIASDCRTGTARRAEYYDAEQKIILIGNARVWQDENVVQGERITMYMAEDRSVVEGGRDGRVAVTFYTNQNDQGKPSRPSKQACQ